jgi:hypothetical protein
MKIKFKLFELIEQRFLTEASLSSDGVRTEDEMIVVRKHLADFDTKTEAVMFANSQDHSPEHGYEIVEVITK